ncbi:MULTISPECIES: GNAT family N-acetyltransferase [Alphaproteobacteria]|uniref:GNAT family N-acetyltransferase n=1 Tax=Alphaproteobacteria TaxID=28211 RepID=UPI0032669B64
MPVTEITKTDAPHAIAVRPFAETDSISELTKLLHRAYGSLADMGLRYRATHQDDDVTRQRVAEGNCFVAVVDGIIKGTIVFKKAVQTKGCPWYDRPGVASIGQFAVEPTLQANGLGRRLMTVAEKQAAASGAVEIALDTAEPATHLVDWYTRLGYRFIEHTQWEHTNYRSVIMSKPVVAHS